MSHKQVATLIGITVLTALILAWIIEQAQVRAFMRGLDQWWEDKNSGSTTGSN